MSSPSDPPKQPPFQQANIGQLIQDAFSYDTSSYNASDADFASRFPGLVQSRDISLDDAYKQLTGPLDPTVQNQFAKQGLAQSLAVTGSGNRNAGVQGGALSGNTAATSIANNVLAKQDYDRSNFQSLLAQNPERAYGLSGSDVLGLYEYNTGIANSNQQTNFLNQVNSANADAQYQQQIAQSIAALGGIASKFGTSFYNPAPYSAAGAFGYGGSYG